MARWEFTLPDIGEGIAEGEIVGWLVAPGDAVEEDQPIVEVMTDKATVTITTPRAGTVVETRGRVGELVAVHATLVVFELGQSVEGPHAAPAAAAPARTNGHNGTGEGPAATAVGEIAETLPGLGGPRIAAPARAESTGYYSEKPLATPATRKHARDAEIDLRRVPPTGPGGRVTRQDVEAYARSGSLAPAPRQTEGRPAVHARRSVEGVEGAVGPGPGQAADERVPFTGIRRKIAQKMAQSKATAAHFTFVEECDVSELKALRERLRGPAQALGVKLSFLPFVVRAVVASLKKHPMLATTLDEASGELVFRRSYNIGIATATPSGLIVPVVKGADRLTVTDIAREIDRLAGDARSGQSRLEDLQGSTFTITSLGAQGGLFATPIINYPEVAILGVHQMKEKPVVRAGQIVIGDVMMLSLSFDHRIVDGHVGAAFAYEVIGYLEHPERLLLE
jgi:pyruvate dehydrogenase E2 component (dihydrolipoamide acetyltransferase)